MNADILIVEDEFPIALDLKSRLEGLGYRVCGIASKGEVAVERAGTTAPDLVIMDIVLSGELDGIEAAERIRDRFGIPTLFLSAHAEEERLRRARSVLPFGYLLKPYEDRDLRITVEMALYAARADAERRKAENALALRNRVAGILLSNDAGEALSRVLDLILAESKSEYGYLGYIDERGDLVCPTMTAGVWEQCQVPDKNIVFGREHWGGLWGKSLIDKELLVSNTPLNPPAGHVELQRAMVCPMLHESRLVGQIAVANKKTDYDERDRHNIETLADFIAPLLNARIERRRHEEARKLSEERLRASLREKVVLLNEIHHRVKNNMQVIASLLSLQALQFDDPKLTEALNDSRSRIRAMALVHETLYRSENLSAIDAEDYLCRLIHALRAVYSAKSGRVVFQTDAEPVRLNVDLAVPFGLVINELVANSLKHAFEPGAPGTIHIVLRQTGSGMIDLTVADDGRGLPPGFKVRTHGTLGLSLVLGLTEEQLGGTLDVHTTGPAGTCFQVCFPNKPLSSRI